MYLPEVESKEEMSGDAEKVEREGAQLQPPWLEPFDLARVRLPESLCPSLYLELPDAFHFLGFSKVLRKKNNDSALESCGGKY